ncbi:TetR/AcrR family transcriptional regulator [Nonomuraea turcica]|uniref:TetR/AcrR family transcriptional regulator n=1 Tax=Nonomuraea sp. G32 TaxID=3067274 RepID=UPI00273A78D7|nr:TetR/AcrR family transcriptional regulator [Nonomuraea sp. G32]MDP4501594.1 TetR/AcrR family transcriptional regulator [Nonomuraea sp. G32]
MPLQSGALAPAQDRRVRRTRSALLRAAVALVAERATAAVPIADLAAAADVSRQVVYQHFGDRDTLLLEAALDLARRELLQRIEDASPSPDRRGPALAAMRHFAEHRAFYRAMLTSSIAFALNKALSELLMPVNRRLARRMGGDRLDPRTADDLTLYLTGGAAAFVNAWLVEGDDPLDPEEFTERLMRMMHVLLEHKEQDR